MQERADNPLDPKVEFSHVKEKKTTPKDQSSGLGLARTPIGKGGGYVM